MGAHNLSLRNGRAVKAAPELASPRDITYLSPPARVNMGDRWFEIASIDHFWIRRRFEVLQRLAGNLIAVAPKIAEIGCGNGLLQLQIEQAYGRAVVGFDLNEVALARNVSRFSPVYCYDIHQRRAELESRFDLLLLFDVLEHIDNEDRFLRAAAFHLMAGGKLVINVPAGQWAYSGYDRVLGHQRRYSVHSLRTAAARNGLVIRSWSYWGLPLLPSLIARKLWLIGRQDSDGIISAGFDSRTKGINLLLSIASRCEPIPQKLVGTSVMALLQVSSHSPKWDEAPHPIVVDPTAS